MGASGTGNRYFIDLKIGNLEVQGLADTGCSHTSVRSDMFHALQKQGFIVRPVTAYAKIANGGRAEIVGMVNLPLNLRCSGSQRSWKGDCLLIKHLPYEMIVGMNTLKNLGAIIDCGKDRILLPSENGFDILPVGRADTLELPAAPVSQFNVKPKSTLVEIVDEVENYEDFFADCILFGTGKQSRPVDILDADAPKRGILQAVDEDWEEVQVIPATSHEPIEFEHPEITKEQGEQFNQLLAHWKEKFLDSPGKTTEIEHKIYLKDNVQPIKQRYYPLSPPMLAIVHAEVKKLLAAGVVSPSKSAWASPVVLVKKKTGEHRMCCDFRRVNGVSQNVVFPLPRIHDMLDKLKAARVVSSIDLLSGYHQVPLCKESRPITAFVVQDLGLFEYNYAPFGLSTMAGTFQNLMQQVLTPVQAFTLVYLDDVLIFSPDFESHVKHVSQVLSLLRKAELQINWKKSSFLQAETNYLGYVVGQGQIKVSDEKIVAIQRYPAPTNIKQVRAFLGLCGWFRRFIKDFADIAAPLHQLLRKGVEFNWSSAADQAFKKMKEYLTSAPILRCPDFSKEFEIHCDASDIAVGGALCQTSEDGETHVIAYTSHTLSPAQKNYSVTERECLALLHCVTTWAHYVYGSKFTVITDHSSLKWLRGLANPAGRLSRWVTTLSQYQMEIRHRKGSTHILPDVLSRVEIDAMDLPNITAPLPDFEKVDEPWYRILRENILRDPSNYPMFAVKGYQVFKFFKVSGSDTLEPRLVVPRSFRTELLKQNHATLPSGHLGIKRTLKRLTTHYYWPRMDREVRKYVRACIDCQKNKPPNVRPAGMMSVKPAPLVPFRIVTGDLIGPLPRSTGGHTFIAVFVDICTKWTVAVPLRRATGKTVAEVLLNEVIIPHGVPEIVLVDQGSQYTSNDFRKFCEDMHIGLHYTPKYFPAANATERYNAVIIQGLRAFAKGNHRRWHTDLPYIVFALRTSVSEATGFTPAKLVYGRELRSFYELSATTSASDVTPFDAVAYSGQLTGKLQSIYQQARAAVRKAKETQARQYNLRRRPVTYRVNELVFRKNFQLSSAVTGQIAKLMEYWIGPFRVLKVYSSTQLELGRMNGESIGRWHVSHVKPVIT